MVIGAITPDELARHGIECEVVNGLTACLAVPAPFAKPEFRQVRALSSFLTRKVLGAQILSWTVDEPQEAARLLRLGVRGVISNHPGRIRSALGV